MAKHSFRRGTALLVAVLIMSTSLSTLAATSVDVAAWGSVDGRLVHRHEGLKVRIWPGFFAGIRI